MEQMCMVNKLGEMLEILPFDREPLEDEYKVPLAGYYERLNVDRYPATKWDFDIKDWVGVGEPIPVLTPEPSEIEVLKANVDYLLLINGEV